MNKLHGYCDGACRGGNPGGASCAYVLYDGDKELWSIGRYLGTQTNNYAEYQGLLGLLFALTYLDIRNVWIYSDSKLVVNQVSQEWKVESPDLKDFASQAYGLLTRGGHKLFFVKGHDGNIGNERADELCNATLDKQESASGC